jgi:hypothetical protein
MLPRALCLVLFASLLAAAADNPEPSSVTCTLDDGQQLSVRYAPVATGEKLSNGKLWTPGGAPMLLFTTATFTLENTQIPAGAYSMYVIPGNDRWTLIVNKNVTAGSKYDEHQDLVRAPMEVGQISQPLKQLDLSFARMGPKLCNFRIYFGKVGAFADFKEQ